MIKAMPWMMLLASQLVLVVAILRPPNPTLDCMLAAVIIGSNIWFFAHWALAPKPAPVAPPRPPFQISAYLVVTLNTRATPPFVSRVEVFSVSAQDLTITGSGQAHLDLYRVRDDNYRKARNQLLRDAPKDLALGRVIPSRGARR